MVISMKIKQNLMKWMGVCLTMTMLTGCTGQAEPTAAVQDETMEQVTIAAIGGSATEGEEAKAFTIQSIGYSDGEETVTEAESGREDMSLSGKYARDFPIGVALPAHVLGSISRYDDVIQNNFNIMTCENETNRMHCWTSRHPKAVCPGHMRIHACILMPASLLWNMH